MANRIKMRELTLHGWGTCMKCSKQVHESSHHYFDVRGCLCMECAFIENKVTEKHLTTSYGIDLDNAHAAISPEGKVVVWVGKRNPPWVLSDNDHRNTTIYRQWRKSVFVRDGYTCQDCEQYGGDLNAHHIKLFSKFKNLRYKISNGVTLCEACHRKRHKKLVV